jgi:hypothetical protein
MNNHNDIKVCQIVRLRVQSGEIIKGTVVHVWEERNVTMVRVESGARVYNIPSTMLVKGRRGEEWFDK